MTLSEVMEEKKGTYSGVKFSKESVKALKAFAKTNEIPNPLESRKYHTTVCYSRVPVESMEPIGKIDPPWIAVPTGFELFGDEKNILVVTLDCPELHDRFDEFINAGASYDYDEYTPHVTLSYDIPPDFDLSKLDIADLPELEIISDYIDPLDLDWGK